MTVREVPKSFIYTCDWCANDHRQENSDGHYTESCPPNWGWIKLYGRPGDIATSLGYLLCTDCYSQARTAINTAMIRPKK
jgi:hypothetical protein